MSTNGNGASIEAAEQPNIVKCDGGLLAQHWAFIRGKLQMVREKTDVAQHRAMGHKFDQKRGTFESKAPSTLTWIPEHIRIAVLKGLAGQSTVEMFLVFEGSKIVGFFITSCPPDEFIGAPLVLNLWIVWSEQDGLLERCAPFVDQLALARGCIVEQHISGRQGWMRRNPAGWRVSQLIYRREVPVR